MAPAMHERPWSLRPLDAGEPIIAVIAVALQELSSKALQELFAMDPTASGRISEQHDWRVSATLSAIVGRDRPAEPSPRHSPAGIEPRGGGFLPQDPLGRPSCRARDRTRKSPRSP